MEGFRACVRVLITDILCSILQIEQTERWVRTDYEACPSSGRNMKRAGKGAFVRFPSGSIFVQENKTPLKHTDFLDHSHIDVVRQCFAREGELVEDASASIMPSSQAFNDAEQPYDEGEQPASKRPTIMRTDRGVAGEVNESAALIKMLRLLSGALGSKEAFS